MLRDVLVLFLVHRRVRLDFPRFPLIEASEGSAQTLRTHQPPDRHILLEIDEWLAFPPHGCLLPLDALSVFPGGFPLLGSRIGFRDVDRQDEIFTLILVRRADGRQ